MHGELCTGGAWPAIDGTASGQPHIAGKIAELATTSAASGSSHD
jgi:hypothetical protein